MKLRTAFRFLSIAVCASLAGCDRSPATGSSEARPTPPVIDEKTAIANFQAALNALGRWSDENDKNLMAGGPIGFTGRMSEVYAKPQTIKTDGLPADLKGAWNELSGLYAELGTTLKWLGTPAPPQFDVAKLERMSPEDGMKVMRKAVEEASAKREGMNAKLVAINEKLKPASKKTAELCKKYRIDTSKVTVFIAGDPEESAGKTANTGPAADESPDALEAREVKAIAFFHDGKLDQADQEFSALEAIRKRILGAKHPDTVRSKKYLSTTRFRRAGRSAFSAAIERWSDLARTLMLQGRITQGTAEFQTLISNLERDYGPKCAESYSPRWEYAKTLLELRNFAEAEKELRIVLTISPENFYVTQMLAECLGEEGKKEEALKLAKDLLADRTKNNRRTTELFGEMDDPKLQDAKQLVDKLEKQAGK